MELNDEQVVVFWQQVNKDGVGRIGRSVCWEWTGYVNRNGDKEQAVFYTKGRRMSARRVAYQLACGRVPRALFAKCNNPMCVNPAHMTGRQPTKIDTRQFMEAASMYASGEHSLEDVARRFDISPRTLSRCLRGEIAGFADLQRNIPRDQIEAVAKYNMMTNSAVLDVHQVRQIRQLARNKLTSGQIKYKLGLEVGVTTIIDVVQHRSWAWVR